VRLEGAELFRGLGGAIPSSTWEGQIAGWSSWWIETHHVKDQPTQLCVIALRYLAAVEDKNLLIASAGELWLGA